MNRKNDFLVLLGAAVGGLVGYALFFVLARRGPYALAIPGGLLGLGAGVFKTRSRIIPVVCGLSALALGLFTEWRLEPFIADAGLGYFLSYVHRLQPLTLIMIAVGALIGFYVPFRRGQAARKVEPAGPIPPAETVGEMTMASPEAPEMGSNAIREVWWSFRRVSWALFGLFLLMGIAGVLLQQAPG